MRPWKWTWLALASLSIALAACGGSGSSGLDNEDSVVRAVTGDAVCRDYLGMMVCEADAPPSSPGAMQVLTTLGGAAPVVCTTPASEPCNLDFSFAPRGFAAGASFRVAVRIHDPESQWVLGPEPTLGGALAAPSFAAEVTAPASTGGSSSTSEAVDVAVVAFASPPANLPAEVRELVELGGTSAFVSVDHPIEH